VCGNFHGNKIEKCGITTAAYKWLPMTHRSPTLSMLPSNFGAPKHRFSTQLGPNSGENLPISFLTTNFKKAVEQTLVETIDPTRPSLNLKLQKDSAS